MNDRVVVGSLQDCKIKISGSKNIYLDDKDLYIVLDGKYYEKDYLKEIKKLYIKYGEKMLSKIDDLFSMYLYDKKNNILIISRDRMGSKTVYYYKNNKGLYFGNDIMQVVDNYKIKKEINIECLSIYFRFNFIKAPETIFKNVYKLENGQYLIYKDNKLETGRYWDEIEEFNKNSRKKIKNKKEIKKDIKDMLEKRVKEFLKDRNNVGVYLSGGVDSSLVSALCKKYSKQKIKTFSIGFYDEKANEAKKAKRIAKYLGTDHHELYIKDDEVKDIVKRLPKYYSEPFGDFSELPTVVLNELGKKYNIKTVITGDGADQLFCGSNIYDTINKVQILHTLFNPFYIRFKVKNRRLKYIFENADKERKSQFDLLPIDNLLNNMFIDNGNKRFDQEIRIKSKNWQEKRMILDIGTFMADRVSIKMGIAAKKNNIDMKTPFFCKEFVEYTFRIPHNLKYHHRNKKYILKEVLYDYIPKELFDKRKHGFGIPIKKWLKEYLYDDLLRVSQKEFIEKQNIFNYDAICNLLNNMDNSVTLMVIWDYYMFQLWYCEYMVNN